MDDRNTTITVTQAQLDAAFRRWELDHREGRCLSMDQIRNQTVDQAAKANTAALLDHLAATKSDS